MATTGNYLNANQREKDLTESFASVIANHLAKRAEEQHQIQLQAQMQMEKLNQAQRMLSLLNASKKTQESGSTDHSEVGKLSSHVDNPSKAGIKVIKTPDVPQIPQNAMMSLASGAYGDAAGNPIAPMMSMANGFGNENATAFQGLVNNAKTQAPEMPKTQDQQMIDNQPDPQYSLDMKIKDGEPTFDIKNNQDDIDKLSVEAAKLGIDPTGKNKRTLIQSIAQKQAAASQKEARMSKQNDFNNAAKLRYEFNNNQITKDFNILNRSFKGITKAFLTSTDKDVTSRIASDQALAVMIQKMLDPASVVRESEYDRTPQGAAIMNRLASILPQLQKGGLQLQDSDRKAIVDMAKQLLDAGGEVYNQHYNRYADLANEVGVDGNKVFGGLKPYDPDDNVVDINGSGWKPRPSPEEAKQAAAQGYTGWDETTGQWVR